MPNVWFSSDQHISHRLVAKLRGFGEGPEAVEAHDAAIADNWRRVVQPGDQVWVLGDIALGNPTAALELFAMLPGEKHLIPGNHDKCHPMYRDSHKWQPRYFQVFASVQPFARRKIEGQHVLLSHLPYQYDRTEVRYTQYRLRDEGLWLIHGHTHGPEKLRGYELHAGVDAWNMTPVHVDELATLMRSGAIHQ